MKNALKYTFELFVLLKNKKNGNVFTEKGHIFKICLYVHETLTLIICQSVRKCPNFLKLWLITNFDMGFQKNDIRSQSEKVDFFERSVFSRTATYTAYIELFCLLRRILILAIVNKIIFVYLLT